MPEAMSMSRCWMLALIVGVAGGCGGGDAASRDADAVGPAGEAARVDDPSTPEDESQPLSAASAPTKTDPCFSAEQSFAWELYGSVFSRCIGCHNSFGLARQVGVALKLTFPGEPDFAAMFNGVDNATVSHDVGPRVAFTGSTRDGLPTLSGLVAGLQGQDMPLAMFVSGGFASTGGMVPITRGGSLQLLRNLASPNRDGIHAEVVDAALRDATRARDERSIAATSSPRASKAYSKLLGFRSGPVECEADSASVHCWPRKVCQACCRAGRSSRAKLSIKTPGGAIVGMSSSLSRASAASITTPRHSAAPW